MGKVWAYDIETMKNFFCVVFKSKDEYRIFEVSARKDELRGLYRFLKNEVKTLIGFNNVRFDAQVIEMFLQSPKAFKDIQGAKRANLLYQYAQDVIDRSRNGEFPPYPEYKLSIPQIDLYLINHYNNVNKSTSLKWLEFSLRWPKVQDLPYEHDTILTVDKMDEVIEYCVNDVDATYEFAKTDGCQKLIKLRTTQDKEYPYLNLKNKADSSVGESLMLHYMSEALNVKKSDLKKKQTVWSKVALKDCILDYISFQTEGFAEVLEKMKKTVVYDGEGDAFNHTVLHGGIEYEFGEGGLHASWCDKVFEEDDNHLILDYDFASFYPNISIKNRFYPKHLSETFCDIYESIYNKRKKIPKSDPRNYSYKIILNGTYGKSKDQHSFLRDMRFQLQITINGQLILAMLAERLSLIDGVTIIQANTDGVTVKAHKSKYDEVLTVCKGIEELTGLELEEAQYKKMVLSNVNNYLAQYKNGETKLKGILWAIDVEPHKNSSQRIVQIALKRYFVDGVPVEDTIKNHLNHEGYGWNEEKKEYEIKAYGIYDFCIGRKVKSNQTFALVRRVGEREVLTDKVLRYYITTKTCRMVKLFDDGREQAINKGYDVEMFMEYEDRQDYQINYQYYIAECNKIITGIEGGNSQIGFQAKLFA